MKKFLCPLVFTAVLLQTTESHRGGPFSRGNGKPTPFSLQSSTRNEFGGNALPQRLSYKMDIKGFGPTELELQLNPRMDVPASIFVQNRSGRVQKSTKRLPTNKVGIYTDLNGHGSFSCKLVRKRFGQYECEMAGLAVLGGTSCYIGGTGSNADCSTVMNGSLEYYFPPDVVRPKRSLAHVGHVDSALMSALIRDRRSIFPSPGFKVVEIAFALDAAFMNQFYDRNPGNTTAAQTEAETYIALLANEMNVFYASVKEASAGELDLYVYPAAVVYPAAGSNFAWSSANTVDGTSLQTGSTFDTALRTFLASAFTGVQHEHAMALTGLDLLSSDGDSSLLGYAYVGTVCRTTTFKYSINEFTDFNVAWVASHELGHALGAGHDDSDICPPGRNVMSPYLFEPDESTADTYTRFSTCSAFEMTTHLNALPDCTANNGFTDSQFRNFFCGGLLGQRDSTLDLQCKKATGFSGSTACGTVVDDVGCYSSNQVTCRNSAGNCIVFLRFVWNGTPCGSGRICFKGRCVANFDICTPDTTTAAPTTDAPTTAAPTTAATTTEAPTTAAPTTAAPTTAAPTTAAPTTEAPTTAAPTTAAPTTAAPTTAAPTTAAPTTEAPTTAAPTTAAPTTAAPTTEAPTTAAPTTAAPTTDAPTTAAPTTAAPTTAAPTTAAPTTAAPTTAAPTTAAPTTAAPTSEAPTTAAPTTAAPTTAAPTTEAPTTAAPTTAAPTTAAPTTAAPTTAAPTTAAPTTAAPTTAAPTTAAPTTASPTTAAPTTAAPTTAAPTTAAPTTVAPTTTARPPPCTCCFFRGLLRRGCCIFGLIRYGQPCRCCPQRAPGQSNESLKASMESMKWDD